MDKAIIDLGTRVVNNYLIPSGDGFILIDTGYAGGFAHFQKMLEKHGVRPEEIRYVFLTHAHDDHAGFLNEVLAATGADVLLHPKAVEVLQRGQNSFEGGCSSPLAWLSCQVLALLGHGEHRFPAIREEYLDRLFPIDSERFKTLHFPCEVLETPGHTADHISLLAGDVLFCGDAAMNGFPSIGRTTVWIEDLQQYRQSWEAIIDKNPKMLYPAHGKPFQTADLQRYLKTLENRKLYALKAKNREL